MLHSQQPPLATLLIITSIIIITIFIIIIRVIVIIIDQIRVIKLHLQHHPLQSSPSPHATIIIPLLFLTIIITIFIVITIDQTGVIILQHVATPTPLP